MVDGAALEKREWACHLVPLDTILCRPAQGENNFYIWPCHPVPLGAKQFVGKMGFYDRVARSVCPINRNEIQFTVQEIKSVATKAFVLIETVAGKNKEGAGELRQLEEVKSVDTVTGPYDIIVILGRKTVSEIGELVTAKIHAIPSISRTVTCLIM